MSELLKNSLRTLTEGFDYTRGGMTAFQLATTNEVLLAIADREDRIDVDAASSTARELGWSYGCTRMLMNFAEIVNSKLEVPISSGDGSGFKVVGINRIHLMLNTMEAQDESQRALLATIQQEFDRLEERSSSGILPSNSSHDEEQTAIALIVIILAIALIASFIQTVPHGDSAARVYPSILHG